MFILALSEQGEFYSFLGIFCLLLFEDFLHAQLEILELVASQGLVVLKSNRVQLQQLAEVILDGLASQFHLDLALEQQVCVVWRQLQFLIGISHASKIKIIKLWQLLITSCQLLYFIHVKDGERRRNSGFGIRQKKGIIFIRINKRLNINTFCHLKMEETKAYLPSLFGISAISNRLQSIDTAIMAEEGIDRHLLDLRIPEDDIRDGSFLDLRHYLSRVGILIPEPISISDPLELLSSNGGSQFAEHRARESDLAEDANVGVDVINAVETFLNDESIELVIEYILEVVQSLQPECHTQGVVISHSMISISVGVDGKEIEVSAHDRRRDISELIHIIQGSLFGQSECQSFQDGIHSQVFQSFGITDEEVEQVDLFHGAIVVVDCFVGMRDVGMADSVGS